METIEAMSTTDRYLELFNQNRGLIIDGDPEFVEALREEGIKAFVETGFPLKKQEKTWNPL